MTTAPQDFVRSCSLSPFCQKCLRFTTACSICAAYVPTLTPRLSTGFGNAIQQYALSSLQRALARSADIHTRLPPEKDALSSSFHRNAISSTRSCPSYRVSRYDHLLYDLRSTVVLVLLLLVTILCPLSLTHNALFTHCVCVTLVLRCVSPVLPRVGNLNLKAAGTNERSHTGGRGRGRGRGRGVRVCLNPICFCWYVVRQTHGTDADWALFVSVSLSLSLCLLFFC